MTKLDLNVNNSQLLTSRLEEFEFSVRVLNALRTINVRLLGELVTKTPAELLQIRNFGRGSLGNVGSVLSSIGLSLRVDAQKDFDRPPLIDIDLASQELRTVLTSRPEEFDFSIRALNAIKTLKIRLIGDLIINSSTDLLRLPNMGRTSLKNITGVLNSLGLRLETELANWSSIKGESIRSELKSARQRSLRQLNTSKLKESYGTPISLESELLVIAKFGSAGVRRTAEKIIKLWGWSGEGERTLQSVGDEYGLTRERIRQISAKAARRLSRRSLDRTWTKKAIDECHRMAPIKVQEISQLLKDRHLSERPFQPGGLKVAAAILRLKWDLIETNVGTCRILATENDLNKCRKAFQSINRETSSNGCANFHSVCETLRISTDTKSKIQRILANHRSLVWLGQNQEWVFNRQSPRNRAINLIRKVLAVAHRITIGELRTAIGRSHRLDFPPPTQVLTNLIETTGVGKFNAIWVTSDIKKDQGLDPDSVEGQIVEVFDKFGPLLTAEQLAKRCSESGINLTSLYIYLTYSPVISRVAPGVYSKIGVEYAPLDLERVQDEAKEFPRQSDYGWTKTGRFWYATNLDWSMITSGSLRTGDVTNLVDGDWSSRISGRHSDRIIKCNKGFISGLKIPLQFLGAESGDLCILQFDLRTREATIDIGPLEWLEVWQSGGPSVEEVAALSKAKVEPEL